MYNETLGREAARAEERHMGSQGDKQSFEARSNGVRICGEEAGQGPPVVLLHGLTATRRYVLLGSRSLERSGQRVIAYDARGHGESGRPEDPEAYKYTDLTGDLAAVLEVHEIEAAVLVGNSMGTATAAAFALAHPARVRALVLVSPAYTGAPPGPDDLADWDRLATGLRAGGVEGFLDAYRPAVAGRFSDTVTTFTRQRLERHHDLEALADALTVVPRSIAFEGLKALAAIEAPTLVVGSRDDADPGHPLAVAESWAQAIESSTFRVEDEGSSPLAWQGAQLSREIGRFLKGAGLDR